MARSIIVTGGFGVLGHAVAEAFANIGDSVTRIDFASEASVGVVGALDIGSTDLTDPSSTQEALVKVLAARSGIDVLVNVAGGFTWELFDSGEISNFSRMHALNVLTTATITQLALGELRKSAAGRIINIGAVGAMKGAVGMAAYAASKSGVHRLTEALAEELAGTSVTVNAVLPSIIDTPTNRESMPDADASAWVSPAAVANVIVLLASIDAGAISGALIPVSRPG